MYSDPIADMLTRIRNANTVRQDRVDVPGSKIKKEIGRILKQEGFIRDYEWISNNKQGVVRVYLKYDSERLPVIHGLRRVSKPGLRVYRKHKDLPKVLGGLGIAIVSTSRGLMSDKEARRRRLGGELICYVW